MKLALRSALLLVLAASPLFGQAYCDTTRSPWTFLRQCLSSALPQGDTVSLARGLQSAVSSLRNPESLNPALMELSEVRSARRFIGSLNLNFITVQQADVQGLALVYDWRRDFMRSPHMQGSSHGGIHSGIEARGQVAPSGAPNPDDFNGASIHMSLFYGAGGGSKSSLMRDKLGGIADSISAYRSTEAYLGSPSYLELMAGLWDSLSTQVYLTGGPEVRFESDQGGATSQWAAGLRMGFDLKVWNPHRRGARFNILDWPAALIRFVTGADSSFRPSGAAIPTVSVMLHRVSPGSNALRDSLANLDPFNRLAVELRWRTKLSMIEQGPLWLNGQFTHHLEFSPDPALRAAGMHNHSRMHLMVETPQGFTLSWAKGTLPFTVVDDDRWGLGFQFKYR